MAKKKEAMNIQIPFGKAGEPVQETSQFGRIPEGTYLATVFKLEVRETRAGDPMVTLDLVIDSAPAIRKHVSDMFVIQSGKNAALFPVQRLHGVLVASGIKQQSKTVSSDALIKNVVGRQLVIEVVDHEIPETDEYEAKKTSRPSGYYRLDSEEADRVSGASAADGDGDDDGGDDGGIDNGEGCDDEDCEIENCDGDHDGDGNGEEEEEEQRPRRKSKSKKSKSKSKKKGSKKSKKSSSDDDDGDGDDGDFDDEGDGDGDDGDGDDELED